MCDEDKLMKVNKILMVCVDSICDYNFNRRKNENFSQWEGRVLTKVIELQLTAEQCKKSIMDLGCCERI